MLALARTLGGTAIGAVITMAPALSGASHREDSPPRLTRRVFPRNAVLGSSEHTSPTLPATVSMFLRNPSACHQPALS
jgi:hypothetical protein